MRLRSLLAICLVFVSCKSLTRKKEEPFRIVEVATRDLVRFTEANGSVEALSIIEVYPPVSGRLEKLFINEGDMVHGGQRLGLISSDARSLFVDMATNKSKKERDYWLNQIQLTPVIAPTSGKVIALKVDLNDKVSGAIVQISTGEVVRANVNEPDLPQIKLGQTVDVYLDIAPDIKLEGKLTKVAQTSRLVNNVNMYQVEVSLPPEDQRKKYPFEMKIGMSVTVYFPVEEKKNALALPITSVDGQSNATIKMVRENDQKAQVKLGKVFGDWVEVVGGLNPGDKLKVRKFKLEKYKSRKSPLMIKKD